jgi:hypothetical protein
LDDEKDVIPSYYQNLILVGRKEEEKKKREGI